MHARLGHYSTACFLQVTSLTFRGRALRVRACVASRPCVAQVYCSFCNKKISAAGRRSLLAAAAERALLVFGMEALGETIENVGLAQEIQNGLVKSLQKEPSWADADEMATKQSEIKSNGEEATYNTRLGKYLMDEWSTSARGATFDKFSGSSSDAWDAFTTSTTFKLLAKYAALGDKVSKEPATNKQFVEARALGRGAFGVVFLVFKKDTGAPLATKKIVKGLAKKNNMVRSVVIEQAVLAKVRSRFCVSPILGAQKAVRTCSPASDMDAINGCCHCRPTAMMQ